MKKIAITLVDFKWLGGVNYIRALVSALCAQESCSFKPVVVVPPHLLFEAINFFPGIEVSATRLIERRTLAFYFRAVIRFLFRRDFAYEIFMKNLGVSVSSHGPALGKNSSIPSLVWLPDFQHLHLPHFFSAQELKRRKKVYRKLAEDSDRVIVSSNDSKNDFALMMPDMLFKVRVLPFSPAFPSELIHSVPDVRLKYNLPCRYVFLPNQFWIHKNHHLVVDALNVLRGKSEPIYLVCTGSQNDPRNPDHYKSILAKVEKLGLEKNIILLGVIPYLDLILIMSEADAFINPSLFEGWSTVVEEAKLLDKRMLLSDIAVHREQAGDNAFFFDPTSADSCAQKIEEVMALNPKRGFQGATARAETAKQLFAERFLAVVREIDRA